MKVKFKTPYNAVPFKGEVNNKPSMTIPDQALSVQEIMRRYASGQPLGGSNMEEMFDGDDDEDILNNAGLSLSDLKKLDISEQHELLAQARASVREKQTELMEQARKRHKDRYKAELIEEIKEEVKARAEKKEAPGKEDGKNE